MGEDLVATIAKVYPLAAVCAHKETKPSLEFEQEDEDNGHHIIVDRCIVCQLPINAEEATYQEVEAFRAQNSN